MENRIKLQDRTFRVMISAEQIDKAVAEVASKLNERYAGREPIFVGVLSGSILFMSDLVRKTTFDSEMTFVKVSSYSGTESTGKVKMELGLNVDIKDRDVIIVEDIVETGHSMKHLLDYFADFKPRSVAICTLFFKPEKFLYDYPIEYVALHIGNEFFLGYGLDYNQLGRNLKDIYVVEE